MGKTSAPPLDGEAIRRARLAKFLTQAEVAERVQKKCTRAGIKFDRSGLSLIESGTVKRPNLKVVRALGQVLDLGANEMFQADDGEGEDEADAA